GGVGEGGGRAGGGGAPTPDQVFDNALKRAGTVRVHSYTQLFAAARMLAVGRIPRGNRLAIVTNGRGPGLLAADCAADNGVRLAAFSDPARAALAAPLPAPAETSHPVRVCGGGARRRVAAGPRAGPG